MRLAAPTHASKETYGLLVDSKSANCLEAHAVKAASHVTVSMVLCYSCSPSVLRATRGDESTLRNSQQSTAMLPNESLRHTPLCANWAQLVISSEHVTQLPGAGHVMKHRICKQYACQPWDG
jgi:hypothetical protein